MSGSLPVYSGTGPSPAVRGRSSGGALTDVELYRRVLDGAEAAMDEVLRRYWPGLVDYATTISGGRDNAEDIAQEVFIRIWQGRLIWRETGTLRSFLYGVARNLVRNDARRWREVELDEAAEPYDEVGRSPLEEVMMRELQTLFTEAVARLPARRKEVFILSRVHGFTYREIAAAMEISEQTVANQMSTALSELRRLLGPLIDAR